ncbi:MAG: hypothetical protein QG549_179 [Patescibacteria group bacterium]|nr:hypothetical protein [Patescibacteria group bacterium]
MGLHNLAIDTSIGISSIMQIKTEAELVHELSKRLQSAFKTNTTVKEFSAGYGIADLVFVKNFKNHNQTARLPLDNYYAVQVALSTFKNKEFTVNDVQRITGLSRVSSLKVIKLMIERGYALKAKAGYVRIKPLEKNSAKKIVAIEAKLSDWKSGIKQARRYKSFTDECYLAILGKYEKNIDYKLLDECGVGLIVFNEENGTIEFKRRAKKDDYLSFYEDAMGVFAKELFLSRALTS